MAAGKSPEFMTFYVPRDEALLAALGGVILRCAHLEYILRMTLKNLRGVTQQEALKSTPRWGSFKLRKSIGKEAREKLGAEVVDALQKLIDRCGVAADDRNKVAHTIWATIRDGAPLMLSDDGTREPLPTVAYLDALSRRLDALVDEINEARFHGFLSKALKDSAPPAPKRH